MLQPNIYWLFESDKFSFFLPIIGCVFRPYMLQCFLYLSRYSLGTINLNTVYGFGRYSHQKEYIFLCGFRILSILALALVLGTFLLYPNIN
jgi:hypothetical protein